MAGDPDDPHAPSADPVAALAAMLAQRDSPSVAPGEATDEAGVLPATAPGIPIEAIADPLLLALVEQRARPEIVRTHHAHTYAREPRTHLDPVEWRTGFLEVHEGGAPPDVLEALRQSTPQAHLRDLFRPIYSDAPVPLDLNPLPLDPGGREAYAELRAAMVREPMPQIVKSLELLLSVRAEWRAFLTAPWQPFLRDEEPRRDVMVAIEPSITG